MKKYLSLLILVIAAGVFAFSPKASYASTGNFNQATATWNLVNGAKCYNIYYGRSTKTQNMWKHSVRCVPNNMWQYTIGYLKQDVSYSYTVAALNYSGKEFSWTPIAPLIGSPMSN